MRFTLTLCCNRLSCVHTWTVEADINDDGSGGLMVKYKARCPRCFDGMGSVVASKKTVPV